MKGFIFRLLITMAFLGVGHGVNAQSAQQRAIDRAKQAAKTQSAKGKKATPERQAQQSKTQPIRQAATTKRQAKQAEANGPATATIFSESETVIEFVSTRPDEIGQQETGEAEEMGPGVEEKKDGILESVEKPPTFPGGEKALHDFLISNIVFPMDALEEGVSGHVVVEFIVEKDGSVGEVKIVRGKHPSLDKEAVRLVKSLPMFNPGMLNGKTVSTWFTLPINFKILTEKEAKKG